MRESRKIEELSVCVHTSSPPLRLKFMFKGQENLQYTYNSDIISDRCITVFCIVCGTGDTKPLPGTGANSARWCTYSIISEISIASLPDLALIVKYIAVLLIIILNDLLLFLWTFAGKSYSFKP